MAEEALRRQAVPDRPCRLWAGGGGPRWTQGSATCASRPSLWPLHQLQHHGGHHSWDGVSVRVLCSQCVPKLATCQQASLQGNAIESPMEEAGHQPSVGAGKRFCPPSLHFGVACTLNTLYNNCFPNFGHLCAFL